MPETTVSSPHYRQAATIRWALLAVAVGAVIAALVTLLVSGGFQSNRPARPAAAGDVVATGAVAGEAFGSAQAGDCLTWNKPDATDLGKTDCTQDHLFEVAAAVDLSRYPGNEFAPGSRFPGVLRFSELKEEHCVPAVRTYLGSRFDPNGKFSVGLINPGEVGWSKNERTLRCGLQLKSNSGIPRKYKGTVAGQDQSKVNEPGVCIGVNQNLPTDPVDCAGDHALEVVSAPDLGARFPGGPPSKEEQDKHLQTECAKASTAYLGSPDALRNKTLTLFWDRLDAASWLAGSRKVNCMIGKGADQAGFAVIKGSARGNILIDGKPPVPPPTNGRAAPTPLPGAAPPR